MTDQVVLFFTFQCCPKQPCLLEKPRGSSARMHGASEGWGHAESQCPASSGTTGEVLFILLVEEILDAQAQLHSGHQPLIGAPCGQHVVNPVPWCRLIALGKAVLTGCENRPPTHLQVACRETDPQGQRNLIRRDRTQRFLNPLPSSPHFIVVFTSQLLKFKPNQLTPGRYALETVGQWPRRLMKFFPALFHFF